MILSGPHICSPRKVRGYFYHAQTGSGKSIVSSRHSDPIVPKGRATVARQFIGGKENSPATIPSSRRDEPQPANSLAGTQIAQCKFPRPDGTPEIMAVFNRRIKILNLSSHSLPDESGGYYQRSFQDQVYKSVDVNVR